MTFIESLVLVGSLLATLIFAADVATWPAEAQQTGPLAVRDYSCAVVQDQVVCERNRTMIALR
jgi:hypothetical protein